MTNKTALRDELLRQNGLSPNEFTNRDREKLHKTIQLSEKRVRRLKRIAGISWIILIFGYFIAMPIAALMGKLSPNESPGQMPSSVAFFTVIVMWILFPTFIVAVVSTISLIVRGGSLRSRQMEDIRLSLRDLENELKKEHQQDAYSQEK